MKEQIERIHEKYEDTWACMMDYLPDCSTCIEYWRGRLDQVYYRTIATLCEAERQKRIDTMFNPDYLDFKKGVEAGRSLAKAECQARVEKLIEDMEQYKTLDVIIISPEAWQAIKKEYLNEREGVDVS